MSTATRWLLLLAVIPYFFSCTFRPLLNKRDSGSPQNPENRLTGDTLVFTPGVYVRFSERLEKDLAAGDTLPPETALQLLENDYRELQRFSSVGEDTSFWELKRQYTTELTRAADALLGYPEAPQELSLLLAAEQNDTPLTAEWEPEAGRYSEAELDSLVYALIHIREENVLEDIPDADHARVEQRIKFLTNGGRKVFSKWLARSSRYIPFLRTILRRHNLPEDLVYLAMIESGFSTKAYSWAHAAGPWQFIGSTARVFGLKRDYWVDERYDIIKSTNAAARFLRLLYDRYDDWYLAFAAYNCGPQRVDRALKYHQTRDYWQLWTLPRETRNYVPMFLAARRIAENPEKYGFHDIAYQDSLLLDTVTVKGSYSLREIASRLHIDRQLLQSLNAQLLRGVTPPSDAGYHLYLPRGKHAEFYAALPELKKAKTSGIVSRHKVRWGESLSTIARRFGVSVASLQRANNLHNSNIRAGQTLLIPGPQWRAGGNTRPGGEKTSYHVKRGDTLGEIAARFGVRVRDIRNWNGMRSNRIYAGQKLTIYTAGGPQKSGTAGGKTSTAQTSTKTPKGDFHLVKSGETASEIASRYSISLKQLRNWNHLSRNYTIKAGQKLRVAPPGEEASSGTPQAHTAGSTDTPRYYTVRKGDIPSRIARRHGITLQQLRAWSHLDRKSTIYPGQRLRVSAGRKQKSADSQTPTDIKKLSVTHTVQPGETAGSIAQRYGITLAELKSWNHITNANKLLPGQVLLVNRPQTNGAEIYTEYLVKNGDSLWEIARRHGVSVQQLQSWNGLDNSHALQPGERILIKKGSQNEQNRDD